jgi:hypothetical protein
LFQGLGFSGNSNCFEETNAGVAVICFVRLLSKVVSWGTFRSSDGRTSSKWNSLRFLIQLQAL